jgi:membrane protein required for beta-lactamase induction
MKKLLVAALASAALLAAGSSAFAGWFDAWGIYHASCYYTIYGVVCY